MEHELANTLPWICYFHKFSNILSKCLCVAQMLIKFPRQTIFQLENVWNQLFNCLHKIQPPIIIYSNFLSLREPLLVESLEYIHSRIGNLAISFWEATYGKTYLLSYT